MAKEADHMQGLRWKDLECGQHNYNQTEKFIDKMFLSPLALCGRWVSDHMWGRGLS